MSVLYSRITDLTALKKMSLAELERKLGFSNGIISTWKKSNPSIDKVEKVANLFDTTTDYLLGRTDDPTIPNNSENHINSDTLTWLDLDMPYGGTVPDELKDYYKAMAEQYIKQHPEILKKRDEK
ncbi:MAG TPA: helix-turn-helix domain-containing protein [Lactobacillus johnsonii]|uniref:Helix-turn-helix domain-containing protein n=1 Tax=Lactobacillus johnsonii TaxID=33959 RepID=A0A921EI19_LACJH|nr:helix-turn-helix domain-containing protein [Lactobacillus johnsonii]